MPPTRTAPTTGRSRRVARHVAVAAALLLVPACGDGDATAAGTTEATGTTSTPPAGDPMVAVVDAYIAAVAEGDLDRAWDLLDERSRSDLGGFEQFEQLRSALSEGIGAWSVAVDRTSHVIRLDDDAAVVLLRGTVPLEGPPAPATQAVLVRGSGDDARVSPFEEALPEGRSIEFRPPPATEVQPATTIRVTVPAELQVAVAVDAGTATTPQPVEAGAGGEVFEVVLPATPVPGGHVVTVAVADGAGDRAASSGLWPVAGAPSGGLPAADVARAFVEAWRAGDRQRLAELAQPAAVHQAVDLAGEAGRAWAFERCEGAAGSAYCSWSDGAGQLVVRVANIAEPPVVTEIRLGA